jgi:integrase
MIEGLLSWKSQGSMSETKVNYLYPEEVPKLIAWLEEEGATKKRADSKITYQQTAAFCHLAYEHGLRVNEVIDLRWNHNIQDTETGYRLKIQRLKRSNQTDQPMSAVLVERLMRLEKAQNRYWLDQRLKTQSSFLTQEILSSYVFRSLQNPSGHIHQKTPDAKIREALKALGWKRSGTTSLFKHACGIQMAKSGKTQAFIQQWLGHVDFSSTEWYLKFAPGVINKSPWE